jgi:hypothetical protein
MQRAQSRAKTRLRQSNEAHCCLKVAMMEGEITLSDPVSIADRKAGCV